MVTTVDSWARRWGVARLDRCEAGHVRHDRRRVHIRLQPGLRVIEDCPAPPRSVDFSAVVFDAATYAGTEGYCPGDCELSRTVLEQGIWEPWQTAVAVDVLASRHEGTVVDFGSHVGWYSLLAAVFGHHAYALDADIEHLAACRLAAHASGVSERISAAVGWLDADSEPLRPSEVGHVRLAKVDLEGAEDSASRVLEPLLAAHVVDYALVELSPEFGTNWRSAVDVFVAQGYAAHVLPDKGFDVDAFEAAPLAMTMRQPPPSGHLAAQTTVLFSAP